MHIETDLLICRRKSLLGFSKRCLCRIHLCRRHTIVKDIPRRTDARCPCIARFMIVLEGTLTRDRARRRCIHRRLVARLCRAHSLLCPLDRIDRSRAVRAIEQPVVRTVIEGEIIARIAQLIIDCQHCIRRHTNRIVQRRYCNLIVVPRRCEILLRVRQLHLRGEHIRTCHRTHAELRIHIREMRLQRRHRRLAHLHQIARLENIEIIHRRCQADRLLRLLERKVRCIQTIARRLALCIQRSIVDGKRDRARIAVVVFNPRALVRFAPNAIR